MHDLEVRGFHQLLLDFGFIGSVVVIERVLEHLLLHIVVVLLELVDFWIKIFLFACLGHFFGLVIIVIRRGVLSCGFMWR